MHRTGDNIFSYMLSIKLRRYNDRANQMGARILMKELQEFIAIAMVCWLVCFLTSVIAAPIWLIAWLLGGG